MIPEEIEQYCELHSSPETATSFGFKQGNTFNPGLPENDIRTPAGDFSALHLQDDKSHEYS